MSILLHRATRVLVQGITSSFAARQTAAMASYGTQVVAGVTPGKGGTLQDGVPVFDTVAEACAASPVDASVIYVPADKLVDAVAEAVDAGIRLVFVTAEGLPMRDMMQLRVLTRAADCWVIGPNSLGIISPGQALLGSFPPEWARPGPIGMISRGGTLLLHTSRLLCEAGIGLSTAAHVGGDMVLARNPVEYLEAFEADPETQAVVLLSEVGGGKDQECAEFIRRMRKPVVGFVVGRCVPEGKAMGHAGALVGGAQHTAAAKVESLRAAGVRIARQPEEIPVLLRDCLQGRSIALKSA